MLEYLQNDAGSHIDMLEPVRRHTAEIIYDGADGVIIKECRSRIYMASMQDTEKCLRILKQHPPLIYAVHQEKLVAALQNEYHFAAIRPCYQYSYPYDQLDERKLDELGG